MNHKDFWENHRILQVFDLWYMCHWSVHIYIYAFSRRFYPKRLTIAFNLYIFFNQYACSLGIEPITFCTADAMLYHWAYTKRSYLVHGVKAFYYTMIGRVKLYFIWLITSKIGWDVTGSLHIRISFILQVCSNTQGICCGFQVALVVHACIHIWHVTFH